jgi:hypothetical protein
VFPKPLRALTSSSQLALSTSIYALTPPPLSTPEATVDTNLDPTASSTSTDPISTTTLRNKPKPARVNSTQRLHRSPWQTRNSHLSITTRSRLPRIQNPRSQNFTETFSRGAHNSRRGQKSTYLEIGAPKNRALKELYDEVTSKLLQHGCSKSAHDPCLSYCSYPDGRNTHFCTHLDNIAHIANPIWVLYTFNSNTPSPTQTTIARSSHPSPYLAKPSAQSPTIPTTSQPSMKPSQEPSSYPTTRFPSRDLSSIPSTQSLHPSDQPEAESTFDHTSLHINL